MRQGGLILAAGRVHCVRRKENEHKNTKRHQTLKNTPRNKSTAAQRPRPPRDGVRRNTSHALAHARTLPPHIPGLWKSASLVYTRMYILAPLFTVLYFLASAASSFSAVILVCISGFGVVRWCLTLSFP